MERPGPGAFGDAILRWLYDNAPIARPEVRKRIRSAVGVREVAYRGLLWRCRPKDNATERQLWLHRATEEEQEIDWLIGRLGPTSVFCDIGANCGVYALSVRAGSGARVVAIEPNPVMAARLEENIALNNLGGVTLAPFAIGAEAGVLTLRMGSRWDMGQASLLQRDGAGLNGDVDVQVRPLLALLAEFGVDRVDAIKIDVEGAEDAALGPFLDAAPDAMLPASLVIEHLNQAAWGRDVHQLALSRGYTLVQRTQNNLLLSR